MTKTKLIAIFSMLALLLNTGIVFAQDKGVLNLPPLDKLTIQKIPLNAISAQGGGGIERQRITYKYTGGDFVVDTSNFKISEKLGVPQTPEVTNAIVNQLPITTVNLASFGSSTLHNVRIEPVDKEGYLIDIDLKRDTINIVSLARMLTLGGGPGRGAVGGGGGDVSDADFIAESNAFLSNHGISTSQYENPKVITNRNEQAVIVFYALRVNNQQVYGYFGERAGLVVVLTASKEVGMVMGVSQNAFQPTTSQGFAFISDSKQVIAIAENGGTDPVGTNQPSSPTSTNAQVVELGAPTQVLVSRFTIVNRESKELLVPALAFPVLATTTTSTTQLKDVVVVSLARPVATPFSVKSTP